jgi:hypothetical protein
LPFDLYLFMPDIRIQKFKTHYHLPSSVLRERHRLEQVRAAVLDEALERALERAGLPENGELCIRKIYAPIRLRLTNSDAEMAMQWSLEIAAEIERAMHDDRATNVVFYRAKRQALLEMIINVARGEFARAWAWRQLGFWHVSDQPTESEAIAVIVRALGMEATMVIPALHALLQAGLLPRVARRMTREQWETLAHAALIAMNIAPRLNDSTPTPQIVRHAMRVLKSSRLLQVLLAAQTLIAGNDDAGARAVATIAILEVEPALLRTNTAHALLAFVTNALRTTRIETRNDVSDASESIVPSDDDVPLDLRHYAATRFGGLLFLLGVIEDLNLPDELLEQFAARGLRWTLHQLALALLAIEADDPAALALAGLQPDALPPAQGPITEGEARVMRHFVSRILARLRALLDWQTNDAFLLAFVCERRAEIIADPGWIEVRFSHDTVATELRRVGLDLDPGYVDWLGVVVKFVYA